MTGGQVALSTACIALRSPAMCPAMQTVQQGCDMKLVSPLSQELPWCWESCQCKIQSRPHASNRHGGRSVGLSCAIAIRRSFKVMENHPCLVLGYMVVNQAYNSTGTRKHTLDKTGNKLCLWPSR